MFESMQYNKTEFMKHKWAATNRQQRATLKCVAAKDLHFSAMSLRLTILTEINAFSKYNL